MTENASAPTEAAIVDEEVLAGKVYEIRGQKVMLDFDLAEIYGYTTSRFNERVRENITRFDGADFMFQLTADELQNLMSEKTTSSWGGRRKPPNAFTEQGVYMLMTVLKGELAIKQSRALIRLFKRMKDYVIESQGLVGQREYLTLSLQVSDSVRDIMKLRASLGETDEKLAGVIDQLSQTVSRSELSEVLLDFGNPAIKRGYFLLNGHPVEAAQAYAEIYGSARKSVIVVDNYIGIKTLVLLKSVPVGVPVTVYSDNKGRRLHSSELADFRGEYPDVDVELRSAGGIFHDRYIAIDWGTDGEKLYHCGASSKDAGERATTIEEIPELAGYRELFNRLRERPLLELP